MNHSFQPCHCCITHASEPKLNCMTVVIDTILYETLMDPCSFVFRALLCQLWMTSTEPGPICEIWPLDTNSQSTARWKTHCQLWLKSWRVGYPHTKSSMKTELSEPSSAATARRYYSIPTPTSWLGVISLSQSLPKLPQYWTCNNQCSTALPTGI